jgi:signal transduction histidine kinase
MVKVLILEHDVTDLDLLRYELRKNHFDYAGKVVQTKDQFEEALDMFRPEIILADYNLPSFDAPTAFQIKERVLPGVPFIIVSGAIGEENAVDLIKRGVTDYVPKDKLFTIFPKINRALKEVKDRKEKKIAEEKLFRERIMHQRMLAQATIDGQEKERAEIGQELHDNINQILSIVKLYLSMVGEASDEQPKLLKQSQDLIDTCINEIRKISQSLIPPAFNEEGLVAAVDELIERIKIARPFSIHFRYEEGSGKEINEKEQLTLYRIIQEQFNNIIKHAGATKVDVVLKEDDMQVVLQISDNGKGFDTGTKGRGVGLNNMLHRVRLFDGDMEIISGQGAGCTLKVCIPKEHEMA